jgi:transposase-like protein/arsenate reductase-like glutaredoxin family protein
MKKQKAEKQKSPKVKTPRVMPDVSEYIRFYKEENYPIRDIAKHFKVSISTVYNAMVASGFSEFRPKHSRLSHTRMSKEEQAIALYQSGLTRTAVVRKLGIGAKTLNQVLQKNEIPIRRGIDLVTSANRAAQYHRAYNDYHLSLRETAELFGVSHPIILRELKRNGYPIRQSVDSKNRPTFKLKHKLGGIAGLPTPKLTPRQKERRQILMRIRQRREDNQKLKRLKNFNRAQEYWQLVNEGGVDFEEAGKIFGVTGKTIERVIVQAGIDISEIARREKAAAFKEQQAIAQKYWELYSKPMSLDEVGEVFGLSDSTIRGMLLKHGYEIRKRGRIENSDRNQSKPRQPKPKKSKQQSAIPIENMEATGKALDLLISNTKVK